MENINDSHSLIINYPINYELFPLANNEKIYTIELNKNEYLLIPRFWFHWVYTEPNTVSVSYNIPFINYNLLEENIFYKSFKYSSPYKGISNKSNINYNDFINSSLDQKYKSIISETSDCSPVIKNNLKKYFYSNTLADIISKTKNDYVYIGNSIIYEENLLNQFSHITTIIDKKYYHGIYFKTNCWFTLDKVINSGLYRDDTDNIIYVLDGKKTIYLFHPNSENNIYKQNFSRINSCDTYY